MDIKKLQHVVVDALEDVKAQDIAVFNTTALSDLFDRVILASGTSNRQTRALAARVVEKVKEAGGEVVSVEGQDTGEWVLVDLGDAVVHVMQPAVRAYYGLEEIWGGKPVRMKRAEEAPAAPGKGAPTRASAAESEKEPANAAPTPRKSAARKSSTATSAAGTAASAAKSTAARKTAARKTTAKKTATKTATARPAAKRAAKKAASRA